MRTGKLIICALVSAGFSTSAIGQEPGRSDYPRYGTEAGEAGKGEIRAKKYPGNLYGIEAFSKSKRMSPEQSDRVSRQVMLRAAQLALENDRPVFSMFTPTNTLSSVRTRRVAGPRPPRPGLACTTAWAPPASAKSRCRARRATPISCHATKARGRW